ncbi:SDR family NAD(P)-dependent oxidoreductase [Streptomyces marincola]|uniref:Short-chain dehydrogenase n=1 Tax=Streptomyces marincola TaxID=2878388 RepID=A0A1W7D1F4_9ACTN|nr:SDR family NAD(P)-dependent oxidoreductase [Streptomyces marincola]ARQ70739.1 short-chain dehydrogenase [Streptomyces marincola]
MSKVIAVFGAGIGLGASVARRFGREGFRVALVARRKDRLDALVAQLADEGIEAAAFPADLSDPAGVPALIDAIRGHFGRIDVVEYSPINGDTTFTPAARLDAATLQRLVPLLLLTPVEVARAVLPEMTERGDGAFLMTTGYSAAQPVPHLSGPGPVMAAARNWLYSLNAELAGTGVYAGTLTVAALVLHSEAAEQAIASQDAPVPDGDFAGVPTVHPDQLAEHYWDMYTKRDHVELAHPVELTPAPASTWSPLADTHA